MRLLSTLVGAVVMLVACKATDNRPIAGSEHVDAALHVDAPPDTSACASHEINCDVTVTCDSAVTPLSVMLCDGSADGPTLENKASAQEMMTVDCTDGATFVATCTASPTAFTCPMGFELEDTTVCIPGQKYDASIADVCAHLPATDDACGHACNRTALYPFAKNGKFTIYLCDSTDGIAYQVGAAPMTGNGSR